MNDMPTACDRMRERAEKAERERDALREAAIRVCNAAHPAGAADYLAVHRSIIGRMSAALRAGDDEATEPRPPTR